ncbi:hypothetical protein Taro_008091 [Colocasia esculenta]|uniref:Inositol polyphosphate-related phosphatase domain-containing protein n=1 Tax=Colocasia esculenta TaxID=4460 RepID=A0A843U047_COLES|nr:hypothetical protein [Colocasia esculenta]
MPPPFHAAKDNNSVLEAEDAPFPNMWSGSVNTKLLHNTSAVDGFVADFPTSQAPPLGKSSSEPIFPMRHSDNHGGVVKHKIFVSTWNVGGVLPEDDIDLADWLDIENAYDIYVLGFQETVPLCARNVLGPERRRPSSRWNSLIRAGLNRSPSSSKDQCSKAGEKQKVHPVKDGGRSLRDYRCVVSKQMVGILISVWVRSDLRRHIRHPGVSCVGCGIMGFLGNKVSWLGDKTSYSYGCACREATNSQVCWDRPKIVFNFQVRLSSFIFIMAKQGSVSVRFCLHGTSFCFVCCHLASGGKQGDEVHRNFDAVEILSRTSFSRGPSFDLPRKIIDHDCVILLGDLNYRISLSDARTRSLVENKEWRTLLERDQLRVEVSQGGVFEDWSEGDIHFSPTYKYYPNSDEYYGCVPGRKGEKRRVPAWCDRILWHGVGLNQIRYDRCECRLSDHRPVRAIFTADVEESGDLNKSLESFFLSERYDRTERSHLELD